ncbi:MAG TPA: uroporphyrinogen-III synthase [Stellaceae bacterium]|nr:uroporphyrinogen-III synthase [Stellaceae bacterium]
MSGPLSGRRIVVPETRELDLFARMLEDRGAEVLRCPMVAIVDAPDPAPIDAWLRRVIAGACDDLILFTGEGLRRLLGSARRSGLDQVFVAALTRLRKITRGPKPVRALREIGLDADLAAQPPTTEGVIATLAALDLRGRRVGVQLYPDSTHDALLGFLQAAGAAADPVLPYAYVAAADDRQVIGIIDRMADGEVDAIAFTSTPQVRRLYKVAVAAGYEARLGAALLRTKVASVGPVVGDELRRIGARVDIATDGSYFMKPLVNEIVARLGQATT